MIMDLAQRRDMAQRLLRVHVDQMADSELDLAVLLLLGADGFTISHDLQIKRDADAEFTPFCPTGNGMDLMFAMENLEIVVGTHNRYDDDDEDKKIGCWYSAHSYFSNSRAEGFNLSNVICRSWAKRLSDDIQFSDSWKIS